MPKGNGPSGKMVVRGKKVVVAWLKDLIDGQMNSAALARADVLRRKAESDRDDMGVELTKVIMDRERHFRAAVAAEQRARDMHESLRYATYRLDTIRGMLATRFPVHEDGCECMSCRIEKTLDAEPPVG